MTSDNFEAQKRPEAEPSKAHESAHGAFMAELHSTDLLTQLKNAQPDPRYEPKAEYKNGGASQDFIEIEKWVDDEKRCGKIDQDKLETKMEDFAKKTGECWADKPGADLGKIGQDEGLTVNRFYDMLDLLDQPHLDKLMEVTPWTLRPGE